MNGSYNGGYCLKVKRSEKNRLPITSLSLLITSNLPYFLYHFEENGILEFHLINLRSCGVEINVLIRHFISKVSATVHKNGYKDMYYCRSCFRLFRIQVYIFLRIL